MRLEYLAVRTADLGPYIGQLELVVRDAQLTQKKIFGDTVVFAVAALSPQGFKWRRPIVTLPPDVDVCLEILYFLVEKLIDGIELFRFRGGLKPIKGLL